MRVNVVLRTRTVYPWGDDGKAVTVPYVEQAYAYLDIKDHLGRPAYQMVQLLECERCEDLSDEVSYYESWGGGACDSCAHELRLEETYG